MSDAAWAILPTPDITIHAAADLRIGGARILAQSGLAPARGLMEGA